MLDANILPLRTVISLFSAYVSYPLYLDIIQRAELCPVFGVPNVHRLAGSRTFEISELFGPASSSV